MLQNCPTLTGRLPEIVRRSINLAINIAHVKHSPLLQMLVPLVSSQEAYTTRLQQSVVALHKPSTLRIMVANGSMTEKHFRGYFLSIVRNNSVVTELSSQSTLFPSQL